MKTSKQLVFTITPTLVTLISMFLGYSAMLAILRGDLISSVWLIYIASFVDLADGLLAKTLKATSRFGGEIDSLTDMVTFGVAPALVMYRAYFSDWGLGGTIVTFFPLAFSALRLARFNVQWTEVKRGYFQGIPTPTSAILIAGFVAFADQVWGAYEYPTVAVVIALSASALMVSNILYPSNAISPLRSNAWKIVLLILSLGSVILFGVHFTFIWALIYVVMGPGRWLGIQLFGWPEPRGNKKAQVA